MQLQLRRLFGFSEYRLRYVGTTFSMKMTSNDKIISETIVYNGDINVLK